MQEEKRRNKAGDIKQMYCGDDDRLKSMYHIQEVWKDEKETADEIRAREITKKWKI